MANEELTLEISVPEESPTEPGFVIWGVSVSAKLPTCWPRLEQRVHSCLYSLPDPGNFDKLVAGDSLARFELDVLNFKLNLFEHTLNSGPRSGYIAECRVFSNNVAPVSDWDKDIADQLLREESAGAMSVRFAFLVDFDSLTRFHRDLHNAIRIRKYPAG